MTPKAYALLTVLFVLLAAALCSAQDAPRKRPCTFEPLPDGRTRVTCPRPPPGPATGQVSK